TYRMLLKSKSSRAPTSDAASAARVRPSRYVRRRSTFQRSSQSTLRMPGEGSGRPVAIESAALAFARVSTALTDGTSRGARLVVLTVEPHACTDARGGLEVCPSGA